MKLTQKIILTKRIWQFLAAAGVVLLAMSGRHYPFDGHFGLRVGGFIFLTAMGLSYLREERRALRLPHSNSVINWNLVEAILFLTSIVGFYIAAFIFGLSESYFFAYLNTGALGLLAGVALGEFLWQNLRLKELNEICREQYWGCYKDSIF